MQRFVEIVSPMLYFIPVIVVVLIWAAKYVESRSYKKVQKDD
jgi:hypothetical protein